MFSGGFETSYAMNVVFFFFLTPVGLVSDQPEVHVISLFRSSSLDCQQVDFNLDDSDPHKLKATDVQIVASPGAGIRVVGRGSRMGR